MYSNQSIFTDRPAIIIIKQIAYVTKVTFFCSMFGPSSNSSSGVFFDDFHFHNFFKNLKPNKPYNKYACVQVILPNKQIRSGRLCNNSSLVKYSNTFKF